MNNTTNLGMQYFMGKDSRMNRDEFNDFMRAFSGNGNKRLIDKLWAGADKNHNGTVSVDEMRKFLNKMMNDESNYLNNKYGCDDNQYNSKSGINSKQMNQLMNRLLAQELLRNDDAFCGPKMPYCPPMNPNDCVPADSCSPIIQNQDCSEQQPNGLQLNITISTNYGNYSNSSNNSNWSYGFDWEDDSEDYYW